MIPLVLAALAPLRVAAFGLDFRLERGAPARSPGPEARASPAWGASFPRPPIARSPEGLDAAMADPASNAALYAVALATVAAASTRGSTVKCLLKEVSVAPSKSSQKEESPEDRKIRGRMVNVFDKLITGGGFFPPIEEGDEGGGGEGNEFDFLDADSYCEYLDGFANSAILQTLQDAGEEDRKGRLSAEKYIECIEKEQQRTRRMQADRHRVLLEKMQGCYDDDCTIPDVSFVAMRKKNGLKKVTALFSLQQQESSNYRSWLIRFAAGDPTKMDGEPENIDQRWPESHNPHVERYKLLAFLAQNNMRLFVERRYNRRDFWTEHWFDNKSLKSEGFDI